MNLPRTLLVALCASPLLGAGPAPRGQQAAASSPAPTGAIAGRLDNLFARKYPAAVYVEALEGREFKPPKEHPVMDQVNLVFTPRVLPVLVGSTVDFPNSDEVRHNVYTTKSSCCSFNLGTYPSGETREVECEATGVITLLCNVHAEMVGYIVVCPTPWFATTGKKGDFRIDGVPPGSYRLTFWHEKLEAQTMEVVVTADAVAEVTFTKIEKKR